MTIVKLKTDSTTRIEEKSISFSDKWLDTASVEVTSSGGEIAVGDSFVVLTREQMVDLHVFLAKKLTE